MVWPPDLGFYPYLSLLILVIYHGRAPGVFFHDDLAKDKHRKNEVHAKIASKINLGATVGGITDG